jgi:hypothetical protein
MVVHENKMCNVSEPLDSPLRQRIRAERTKGEKHPEKIGMALQVCEEPFVIARPSSRIWESHRRIPVDSIGRDLYANNRVFLEPVQGAFPEQTTGLAHSPADYAYEAIARYGCHLYRRR